MIEICFKVFVPLTILNDAVYQSNKTVYVELFEPLGGALLSQDRSSAVVIILDDRDSGTFTFSQTLFQVKENNAMGVNLTITRTGEPDPINTYDSTPAGHVVSVDIETDPTWALDYGIWSEQGCSDIFPCAAEPGTDYIAIYKTISFADRVSSVNVSLFVIDNALFESPNKLFRVRLSNPQGAHLADLPGFAEWEVAVVKILDDVDPAIILSKVGYCLSLLSLLYLSWIISCI